MADKGKLKQVLQRGGGAPPNGTEFAITTGPAPELDRTNLVIGRVVEGMPTLRALSSLPTVKNNKDSPFFKAGKAVGDKRADVAELGFDRPLQRVIIAQSTLA